MYLAYSPVLAYHAIYPVHRSESCPPHTLASSLQAASAALFPAYTGHTVVGSDLIPVPTLRALLDFFPVAKLAIGRFVLCSGSPAEMVLRGLIGGEFRAAYQTVVFLAFAAEEELLHAPFPFKTAAERRAMHYHVSRFLHFAFDLIDFSFCKG